MLDSHLKVQTAPVALKENVILWRDYRVTVLGDRLFRVEKNRLKAFRDCATQSVWFRNMPKQDFSVEPSEEGLSIVTTDCTLVLKKRLADCRIVLDGNILPIKNDGNLLGTARTLDCYDGDIYRSSVESSGGSRLKLGIGVCSRSGVAYFDDVSSLSLGENGEVLPEKGAGIDRYVFAFGNDYRGAVKALYSLTGNVPLIPRFVLGNWWSRYYAYTQDEYLRLMQKFEDYDIPLTVATIDMDWHYSNNLDSEKKITELSRDTEFFGGKNGWTGYSWNKNLFPDYKNFLKELKRKNLAVTLNVHPADGVRWFEDMYPEFAKALGVNPNTGERVPFNIANADFINAYFKILHRPYEKDGVDFWWIDWQQGTKSDIAGLDPLWSLNHYHYLDNAKCHTCPLILSRYSGIGSHRYPLGFSGDSWATWKTLKYISYFTFTASNVGYTWWSHDIGGHLNVKTDGELFLRFEQFGVFSPINRLHSMNGQTITKEPWAYKDGVGNLVAEAMRLRHRMIPFLYSCSKRTHTDGIALIEPLYYEWKDEEAYKERNGYIFGGQMLVYPITGKCGKDGYAKQKAWLPEGHWTDIFTGMEYYVGKGGKNITFLRSKESIPVLAKSGAIFPLSLDKGNCADNPETLEVNVFCGNGEFTLFEDNRLSGGTEEYSTVFTTENVENEGTGVQTLRIHGKGLKEVLPKNRKILVKFRNIDDGEVFLNVNGESVDTVKMYKECVSAEFIFNAEAEYSVSVKYRVKSEFEKQFAIAKKMLTETEEEVGYKSRALQAIMKTSTIEGFISAIMSSELSKTAKMRLTENL